MRANQDVAKTIAMSATYGALIIFCAITLVPFLWLACGALKTPEDFFAYTFLPLGDGFLGVAWERLTFTSFWRVLVELNFANNILNSFFLAGVSSLLASVFAAMGGYALAKFRFRGRAFFTNLVIAALIIPGPLLLASSYQLLYHLGLLNTYMGLILPAIAPAFGVFLFRQAILNAVPTELLEAARIDGCGEFRIFATIVFPLVKPMVGAYLMITFLGTWNNFIMPQVVLQDPEMQPLSVAIAQLRGLYTTDYALISAGTLVSIAPVACLFLLLQKDFIAGLTSGSVKG